MLNTIQEKIRRYSNEEYYTTLTNKWFSITIDGEEKENHIQWEAAFVGYDGLKKYMYDIGQNILESAHQKYKSVLSIYPISEEKAEEILKWMTNEFSNEVEKYRLIEKLSGVKKI